MAIIKKQDLKNMSEADMNKKMNELNLELAKERAKINVGGVAENPGKIREMKRTIARIIMIKNQKKSKE